MHIHARVVQTESGEETVVEQQFSISCICMPQCHAYSCVRVVQTESGEETVVEQQFSVDDTQPSFQFYQRYIIMSDHATIVRPSRRISCSLTKRSTAFTMR